MRKFKSKFLYFGLDDSSMELLLKVCEPTDWIELFPLDKGLSGSKVLMGRWSISDIPSKFHVFKIGIPRKLRREYDAITKIAAPLVKNFPNVTYEETNDKSKAILSQEFMGDSDGSVTSLKQYIEKTNDPEAVTTILERLYTERIMDWIPKSPGENKLNSVYSELRDWINKGNLDQAIDDIGRNAVKRSLESLLRINIETLSDVVDMIFKSTIDVQVGPVHGDLHSQNIVINENNEISLIDFGWTATRWRAIDYLWLECSLKFVVSSPYIPITEMLKMDEQLDSAWSSNNEFDHSLFDSSLHGNDLKKISQGILTIRRNVKKHISNIQLTDYLKGLVAMMYALTTFPQLNRVYLVHSLARIANALLPTLREEGPYNRLYKAAPLLWPNRPGRMVKKAAKEFREPGLALDVGCGDGKDIVYLEDLEWDVTGIDICTTAIEKIQTRAERHFGSSYKLRSKVLRIDATQYIYEESKYDLVLAYGLYHCLDDEELKIVHEGIVKALKRGGLLAFAAFNDELPVPDDHETGKLYLRDKNHIFNICSKSFEVVESEIGTITEYHKPLVGEHSHSVTWALLRKR